VIAAERIARVLGGPKVLGRQVRSADDLRATVAHGLPRRALDSCASWLAASPRERRTIAHQIVPEATYKRRRTALKPAESERTERLARVIATAEYVWDDRDAARRFLLSPNARFGGERPIDIARTEIGARQVEELLWQLYHGLPV
jgi:putative toxin-antitoxin system antitoxin component (TIGR02293 family)